MQPTTDASATTGLTEAVRLVLPALEQFLRFDDRDLAATRYAQWRAALNESLPERGAGAQSVLEIVGKTVIPHGVLIGAPGFSGWVNTMPTIVPTVAAFTATIAGAQRAWLQSYNFLENLALEWLKQLLGLPPSYQGIFSSGGSVANLIALGAARQWAYEQNGIDPARDGLASLQKPRLYASNQVHHVVQRAAAVLGLGRRALIQLPTDNVFRLDVNALREQLRRDRAGGFTPVAVIASAGTVNTGAIDPVYEIAQLCHDERVWLHVDGAYGAFGNLDSEVRPLFAGLSEADSLAVDPHKWLAVPLGCGATFVRDRELLGRAFTLEPAEYLEGSARQLKSIGSQFDDFGHAFHHFTVEQSAQSRGVTVWAALKEMGAEGMRARVRAHNSFARHLAARVQASSVLELLAPVTLSICCFRYVPLEWRRRDDMMPLLNDLNREVLKRLHHENRYIPSSTELNGAFAIRSCYINPRTTLGDVDGLVQAVERLGEQVWREHQPEAMVP